MAQILSRLAALNFLALLAAFVVGLLSWFTGGLRNGDSPLFPLHLYLGLFAIFLNLGVHCLVFIYFLGTGRWVKEVAEAYRLPDVPLPKLTRDLKRRTFPVALLAMVVPIVAAIAGAEVQHQAWHWTAHLGLAVATLLVNAWAFVIEYRNVSLNATLLKQVEDETDRIRVAAGLPTSAETLRQEEEREKQEAGRQGP